jgi:RNA polymerase sigma-70 factor (ECF subfamily)
VRLGGFRRPVSCRRTPQYGSASETDRRAAKKTVTSIPSGDRHDAFPSTRWSRILAREGPRDLEALAQDYWRPIQAYLGTRLRLRAEEAADLAQDAFAWILATRFFERADPARGRFRGLLKKALSNFAIEHLRRQAAGKRGGGRAPEPLDGREPADPRSKTPDEALDEAWRRELLERARARLEAELESGGKRTYYLLFRDYFLDEGDDVDHAALAARYAITKTDVANWLDHGKRRYRELLRALVLETVSGEQEYAEELRWLFGAKE